MSDAVDIEALRRQYLAELAEAPATKRAGPTIAAGFDSHASLSVEDLEDLPLAGDSYRGTLTLLLDLLGDDSVAPPVRLAALRHIAAAAFQPVAFAPFNAEFVETLRRVALDANKDLRLAALDQLTLMDDPEANRMLRQGLEGEGKALVPAATAVRLLARDEHGDSAPLFRDLARTGAPRVREQALRALAADPQSADLLESVSADKSEKPGVRQVAAMSLKAAAPARFADLARSLVLDEDDDDALRAAALSGITHTSAASDVIDSAAFTEELRGVEASTTSRSLRTSIRRFAKANQPEPE